MKSKIKQISVQYIELIESEFDIGYTGELFTGADEIEVHWSPQLENTFSSRCRELFYYSVNDVIDDFHLLSQDIGTINALHYGPIGSETDIEGNLAPQSAIDVASQALLMADTVIFQDLIYRNCSSSAQLGYSIDERRDSMIRLLIETIKLKPLIEKGLLTFIPWFPQWGNDFASATESIALTISSSDDEKQIISNVISVAAAINGVPFTTFKPANALMNNYLNEINNANTQKGGRYFQILDHILKDESFAYIQTSSPKDIVQVSENYKSFRNRLRYHFRDLISCDYREFQMNLPGAVEVLKDEISKAKTKTSKQTWSRNMTIVSSGIGSILAASGLTADGIMQQGLLMGAAISSLKPLKDLFDWVKFRFSPEEENSLLCQALIELENKQPKYKGSIQHRKSNELLQY